MTFKPGDIIRPSDGVPEFAVIVLNDDGRYVEVVSRADRTLRGVYDRKHGVELELVTDAD